MTAPTSLDEVREAIDGIDREIVRLLAARGRYVEIAAQFKATVEEVAAPRRVEQVIARVRRLAAEHELDPAIVERVYRAMIAAFIDHERTEFNRR